MNYALPFALFILGTFLLFTAMHNIDNAWNMRGECWDTSASGIALNKTELYKAGYVQIFFAFAAFFAAFLLPLNDSRKDIYGRVAK